MQKGGKEKSIKLLAYAWIAWFVFPFLALLIVGALHLDQVSAVLLDSRFLAAFGISLVSAIMVIFLAGIFSVPVAYVFTYHDVPFKHVLEALLVDIPQTAPPVAVGVIYLFAFGPGSPINVAYTFVAVVIAKLLVSAPFAVSYTLRRFREIRDSRLDLVARSLGAQPRHLVWNLLIPLSREAMTAGMTLTGARAMGEFGGSLIFAGVIAYRTEVLPTYTSRVVEMNPYLALAAAAVMGIFALFAIVIVRKLVKK